MSQFEKIASHKTLDMEARRLAREAGCKMLDWGIKVASFGPALWVLATDKAGNERLINEAL